MKESILAAAVTVLVVVSVLTVANVQHNDIEACKDKGISEARCYELLGR
jgi:hypothetical protein